MAPNEDRQEFADAVARAAVARDREDCYRQPPSLVPMLPPTTVVHIMLGGVGGAAFLIGFLFAVGGNTAFKQLAGLISLVIGSVLIVGGLIVEAITRLRLDLWRARQTGRQ